MCQELGCARHEVAHHSLSVTVLLFTNLQPAAPRLKVREQSPRCVSVGLFRSFFYHSFIYLFCKS